MANPAAAIRGKSAAEAAQVRAAQLVWPERKSWITSNEKAEAVPAAFTKNVGHGKKGTV